MNELRFLSTRFQRELQHCGRLACTAAMVAAAAMNPIAAEDHRVASAKELAEAVEHAAPGDSIILADGEWTDADLHVGGQGAADKPITVKAQTPGGVRLTGASRLRVSGQHLHISGLWFDNCDQTKSDIISFRFDSKQLASHCTLTDCAITQSTETRDNSERKWLSLYGSNHTIERCRFSGKTSKGTMLVVWLPEQGGDPVAHMIRGNMFAERPRLGKNGGEIIRIGDSKTSMQNAGCLVEFNWFKHCDGEVECISNKSCENTYRGNVFFECQGTLTLRHGNRCVVERNYFDGNMRRETGGIRIIGEDHRVLNNTLVRLTGDDARAAICFMNAERDPQLNGYWPLRNALIEGNTILDCRHGILIGYADDDADAPVAPADCHVAGNRICSPGHHCVELRSAGASVAWSNNVLTGLRIPGDAFPGITWIDTPETTLPEPPVQRDAVGTTWLLP